MAFAKMRNSLKLMLTVSSVLLMVAAAGCGRAEEDVSGAGGLLQVKGSDTLVNLIQREAEVFMENNPQAQIAVTGGGSGTGIAALINGTADLANASREIKDKEINQLKAQGKDIVEFAVARDGLSVIVNPENPVARLSFADLERIFTGQATNWKEFGGEDAEIIVMSRESSSGTHVFFKEHVLANKDYVAAAMLMPSNQAIVEGVAQSRQAIGYVGMGYVSEAVKALAVAKDAGAEFVEPALAKAKSGEYPITRALHIYSAGEPQGLAKDFVDFILSPAGQNLVEEMGFVPVK